MSDGKDGGCFCCGGPMPLKDGWAQVTIRVYSMFSEEGMIFCWRCHQDPARIDIGRMGERMARAGWKQEDIGFAVTAMMNFMAERQEEMEERTEGVLFLQAEAMEYEEAIKDTTAPFVLKLVTERLEEVREQLENELLLGAVIEQLEEAIDRGVTS